jgi:hypothetical protein
VTDFSGGWGHGFSAGWSEEKPRESAVSRRQWISFSGPRSGRAPCLFACSQCSRADQTLLARCGCMRAPRRWCRGGEARESSYIGSRTIRHSDHLPSKPYVYSSILPGFSAWAELRERRGTEEDTRGVLPGLPTAPRLKAMSHGIWEGQRD